MSMFMSSEESLERYPEQRNRADVLAAFAQEYRYQLWDTHTLAYTSLIYLSNLVRTLRRSLLFGTSLVRISNSSKDINVFFVGVKGQAICTTIVECPDGI